VARNLENIQNDHKRLNQLAAVKADPYVAGHVAGVHAHARVTFFLSEMKMPLEPGQLLELACHVGGLRLDFLHANTIRTSLRDPVFQPFAGG